MQRYFPSSLRRGSIHPLYSLQISRSGQYRCCSGSSGRHYGQENRQQMLPEHASSSNSSSSSLLKIGVPSVLLGFMGVAALIHYNDERRAMPKGQGGREGVAPSGPTIGGPFTLINTQNQTFTHQDLLGKWSLVYFGYTSSPEIGPSKVQKMARIIDLLESEQKVNVLPVFVTVDPQRDTPSHLKAYLKEFDSRIMGLTGSPGAVKQMAQEYRVFFRKVEEDGDDYLVESSHNMYLINPKAEVVRSFDLRSNEKEMVDGIAGEIGKR